MSSGHLFALGENVPRVTVFKLQVHFGDCDPAGIAFYPNFFRWYDAASLHYFRECGIPSWRETEKTSGIIGVPIVESVAKFYEPVTYGDHVEIHTSVEEWQKKIFVQKHELMSGDERRASSHEKRVFARRDETTGRLRAIPIPADIRAMCK